MQKLIRRINIRWQQRHVRRMVRSMKVIQEQYKRDLVDPEYGGEEDQEFLKYELNELNRMLAKYKF